MNDWIERYRTYIVFALALMAVMGGILFWISRPQPAPLVIATPAPTFTPTPPPALTPAALRIYVTGAVHTPDVYLLPSGSIVKDALLAAGGATEHADLNRLNLALELADQQQIYVPHQGETTLPAPLPAGQVTRADAASGLVNINTASLEELDSLSGIGPAIAQRIIEYRLTNGLFASVEDLMKVKGIGPNTFAKIKDAITTQ